MRLFFNKTSPYARKARIAVHELGLAGSVAMVELDPWAEPEALVSVNPLSKVPALEMPDGRLFTESDMIVQVLDLVAPAGRLVPENRDERRDALARAGLSQGLIDASFITVLETRRPQAIRWHEWVARQERSIGRTVAAIAAADPPPANRFDIGDLGLATALAYLDFRLPQIGWRAAHGGLARWLDAVASRPSMIDTAPA